MTDDLSQAIVKAGDDARIQALLDRVCELTGMGFAAVSYVTETKWIACQVDDRIAFGLKPGDELEIKKTLCGEVRLSGERIAIDDTTEDPDWWNHPLPTLYGFRSYASLPIVVEDSFIGTLCVIDDVPRERPFELIIGDLERMAQEMAGLLETRLSPELLAN